MPSKPSEAHSSFRAVERDTCGPVLTVRIPGLLRSYTHGAERVQVALPDNPTLGQVLAELDRRFPGLRFRIIDEQGAVRQHIKLFVDGTLCRDLEGGVRSDGEVMIVGALSGG